MSATRDPASDRALGEPLLTPSGGGAIMAGPTTAEALMNDPNLVASPEDVFALLAADGVPHRVDAEHGQVLIPTRLGSEDAVLTLRWASADGLLQLFQDLGEVVAQPKIAAVEEAITRLNHAMPVPGFELNPEQGRRDCRLTVPVRQGPSVLIALVQLRLSVL